MWMKYPFLLRGNTTFQQALMIDNLFFTELLTGKNSDFYI
jgi:hypothetical protein